MKTVYYAHPMALYGTNTELSDLCILRELGFKVINPAEAKYQTLQMSEFVELARSADVVAFRSFPDGKVGSGMALELDGARGNGVPIIELDSVLEGRTLTRNQTRDRMGLPPLGYPNTAPIRTLSDNDGYDTKYDDGYLHEYHDQDWGAK